MFVVEVDVVLNFSLMKYDIFYLKVKNEKNEIVLRIYKFEKNVLKVLLDEDLKNYIVVKLKIVNNRKDKEVSLLLLNVYKNLWE